MKTYIGTKIIKAAPLRNSNGQDGYQVMYPDGYTSWSPKDVFEEAYRETSGINFGLALEAMKRGHRVARAGWNGKGMWLSLSGVANVTRDVPAESFWSEHNARYAAEQPDRVAKVLPCITMKTATGEILMGWLASQTDMLADDWTILP